MVNTGHPSMACRPCLARRVKCDETKPVCRKCQKSKRPCSYRDFFEIRLRDETESTIRKARSATQRKPLASPDSVGEDSGNGKLVLAAPPQFPLDEQAKCFFLENFVVNRPVDRGEGTFKFIVSYLKSQSPGDSDSVRSASFTAASMAALAGRPNARSLLPKAQAYYDRALAKLKKSLEGSEKTGDNDCLAAVILLSIYEVSASLPTCPPLPPHWRKELGGIYVTN